MRPMKGIIPFCLVAALAMVCLAAQGARAGAHRYANGPDTKVESMQIRTEIWLLPEGGSWANGDGIKVYDGADYLEQVGTGPGSVAGSLNMTTPPPGKYVELKGVPLSFRVKAKVKVNGTVWYTTKKTVVNGQDNLAFSTDSSLYDYETITLPANSENLLFKFPTPLTVTAGSPVHLTWATDFYNSLILQSQQDIGTDPDMTTVNWIDRYEYYKVLLPAAPALVVSVPVNYSGGTANTVSMMFDSAGNLLGAYCSRPTNQAMNASFVESGSVSNVAQNGKQADFSLVFADRDLNGGTYTVTGSYACTSTQSGYATKNSYTNLAVATTGTVNFNNSGTLTTSGTGGICLSTSALP